MMSASSRLGVGIASARRRHFAAPASASPVGKCRRLSALDRWRQIMPSEARRNACPVSRRSLDRNPERPDRGSERCSDAGLEATQMPAGDLHPGSFGRIVAGSRAHILEHLSEPISVDGIAAARNGSAAA
jgi:hypothetical protein